MYTSIDPERPYAGKRLALHIEERTVAAYGSLNGLLVACGFEFVENTFGDKLYRHTTTGEVIRMKYINRDAWQVEREPVEEPKKARKRARVYVMETWTRNGCGGCHLHEMSEAQFEREAAQAEEIGKGYTAYSYEIVSAARAHAHVMRGGQHNTPLWVDIDAYGKRRIRRAESPE